MKQALAALPLALLIGAGQRGPVEVSQEGRAFAPGAVTIQAGERLRVLNDDRFVHNVRSETEGFAMDSKAQRPGEAIEVAFGRPGRAAR